MASGAGKKRRTGSSIEKKGDTKNSIFRFMVASILFLVQILLVIYLMTDFRYLLPYSAGITMAAVLMACLFVYGGQRDAAAKSAWIIIIMIFPVPGIIMYLFTGRAAGNSRLKDHFDVISRKMQGILLQDERILSSAEEEDPACAGQMRYILKQTKMPVVGSTDVMYYSDAAEALRALTGALQMARRYIFMEYHAIENGEAFARIRSCLAEKAREGVEVRILYDDVGSGSFLSSGFIRSMEAAGCRCRVFRTEMPFLAIFRGRRDNRKLTVIDGRVGFVGSYNLSDECFGYTDVCGSWKDVGAGLAGEAARHLAVQFLQMWNLVEETDSAMDYDRYVPGFTCKSLERGVVQPFGTGPLTKERTAEEICMNLLRTSRKYVWFMTPCIQVTEEMARELTGAAKRGVDVRILVPGIPDRRLVHTLTRAYYPGLLAGGVRIFEYTPGFTHAGLFLADDTSAIIGTVSLSARSFSRYYENGVLFSRCSLISKAAEDFRRMFKQSREISSAEVLNRGVVKRLGQGVLRLAGALL